MIELVPGLQGLLNYFSEERHLRTEQHDQALTAIYTAACETKIYLEKLEKEEPRDRETEEKLARLWALSAVPVRHFDRDLADRCLKKADSWISPERWTDEAVKTNRIGICDVWEDARKLLMR